MPADYKHIMREEAMVTAGELREKYETPEDYEDVSALEAMCCSVAVQSCGGWAGVCTQREQEEQGYTCRSEQ